MAPRYIQSGELFHGENNLGQEDVLNRPVKDLQVEMADGTANVSTKRTIIKVDSGVDFEATVVDGDFVIYDTVLDKYRKFNFGTDPLNSALYGFANVTDSYVTTAGMVDTGLTGLIAGAEYFADVDGTISTTATDSLSVGIAFGATTLIANVSLVYTALAGKVDRTGDTMTGQLKGITPVDNDDMTIKGYVDTAIEEGIYYGLSWRLDRTSYDSKSLSVGTQQASPNSLFFTPNGTKVFVMDLSSDTIYQYNLSTAWDVSTGTYASISFSVSAQDTSPSGLFFTPDGTKMYIIGLASDRVHQYSLSTPWDITTVTYDNLSFSINAQEPNPYDVNFSPDGTKMYIVGELSDRVHQYSLSTPWDITTVTYDNKSFLVNSQEGVPTGVVFRPDGKRMYIIGSGTNRIYQYNLSTAWDVSTCVYSGISYSVSSLEGFCSGLMFKTDGTKLYVVGYNTDKVYQFTSGL